MRNQTWDHKTDRKVRDIEVKRLDGKAVAVDHLSGDSREATSDEEAVLIQEEAERAGSDALARALAALEANKGSQPWAGILTDLCIHLGLITPPGA